MKKAVKIFFWVALSLAGAFSIGYISLERDEPVNAIWLVVAATCVFLISYRFYSAWLAAKVLVLDEKRATPACVMEDGKDYVKTNSWVVFGHHFAAIAGPGPLVGPVLAAQFGYLPGALWILVGAALGGAVHDMVVLFCSTRRGGKSLGQMVKEEIGSFAGIIALLGIISILIILIAVLSLVVVKALDDSPWGVFTIAMTMPIALLMGTSLRYICPKRVALVTILGVIGLLLAVYFGKYATGDSWLGRVFDLDGTTLAWAVIIYGFAASTLPVWLLLAPRDYLSTFMKVGTVALLAVAVIFIAPRLQMPAVTKFIDGTGPVFAGPLFPFCFITIACGAISGFHSLISSGTTPKLITRESCIRRIGYGAMIVEMMVAIMALIAASAMKPGIYFSINMKGEPAAVVQKITASGFPVTEEEMKDLAKSIGEKNMIGRTGGAPTFAVGMAKMFEDALGGGKTLPLWYHFAIMFEALFILTTIDAGTRVGRFLVQDLLGHAIPFLADTGSILSNITASALFVSAWGWFLYQGVIDPLGGINSLWPIFGIANQLLAVIAFALGTTVLIKMGKMKYVWITIVPLCWLLAVTMTAGFMKIFGADPRLGFLSNAAQLSDKIKAGGTAAEIHQWKQLILNNYINTAVSAIFMLLVILIVAACAWEWYLLIRKKKESMLRESPYCLMETL